MRYLFFDIECANCFNQIGKICEFGYVLTNENLEVIKKDCFLISPGREKFDKKIYKRDPNFQWAFSFEEYYQSPLFPIVYDKIRTILEAEHTILLGFSVHNDVQYLHSSCERYKLRGTKYRVFDIQIMIKNYLKIGKCSSLKDAFITFYGINEFIKLQPHFSQDDAYISMMIFKRLCEKTKLSATGLIEKSYNSSIDSFDFIEQIKRAKERKLLEAQLKQKWSNFYKSFLKLKDLTIAIGKRITMTNKCKECKDLIDLICEKIKEKDYFAVEKACDADFIICYNKEEVEKMKNVLEYKSSGTFITADCLDEIFMVKQ